MRLLRHIILLSDSKRTNELVVSVQHFDYSLNRRSKSSNLKFRDKGLPFWNILFSFDQSRPTRCSVILSMFRPATLR